MSRPANSNDVWFERAIFISWYCAKQSCKFCFMYTLKDKIRSPEKARRRISSILAEALICKICNWKIGFISAGISSWSTDELENILRGIYQIYGERLWLNLGTLKEEQVKRLLPYIKGITGTVECVNNKLRKEIVPDKPISKIDEMFKICDKYSLQKSITIIIGLGETIDDFKTLEKMIKKWNINRIIFYRLIPHKGSGFKIGPSTRYYVNWIAMTHNKFPELDIVAGTWRNKSHEVDKLLDAGANSITKLPSIKLFGKRPALELTKGVHRAGKVFQSNLTELPVYTDSLFDPVPVQLRSQVKSKFEQYYNKLRKNTININTNS